MKYRVFVKTSLPISTENPVMIVEAESVHPTDEWITFHSSERDLVETVVAAFPKNRVISVVQYVEK